MTEEQPGQKMADYLKANPIEAKRLSASISEMMKQYDFIGASIATAAKDYLKTQTTMIEAFKKIYVPNDLFSGIAKTLAGIFPSNWPRPLPELSRIEEVLEVDGIPIVHIPRAEIVQLILDADNYDSRMNLIDEHADDIAADCAEVLDRDHHDSISKHVPLARSAVKAYQDGHFEAAQALAVALCDTYLKRLFHSETKRVSYGQMASKVQIENGGDAAVAVAFNFHYALAPAAPFLVPWTPGDEVNKPTKLSRHRSIHGADTDHMTKSNATIAIMLMTSMTEGINYAMKRSKDEG